MGIKGFLNKYGVDATGNASANENHENGTYQEEEQEEEYTEQEYSEEKSVSIRVFRPKKFEEATEIAANLLEGCLIFLNLEATDKVTSRRILDYLLGATYILEGDLQPVSSAAFIISPRDVDISGAILTQDPVQVKSAAQENVKQNEGNGGFSSL